jgi:hypothetical protein
MIRKRSLLAGLMALTLHAGAYAQSFSAYSRIERSIGNQGYSQVIFDGIEFVRDSRYFADHSMWCPDVKTPMPPQIDGQIWIIGGFDYLGLVPPNPALVAKVFTHNNDAVFTGIGVPDISKPGTAVVQFHKTVLVQPGFCYWVGLFASAADYEVRFPAVLEPNTVTLDKNPLHQYWSGHVIR